MSQYDNDGDQMVPNTNLSDEEVEPECGEDKAEDVVNDVHGFDDFGVPSDTEVEELTQEVP